MGKLFLGLAAVSAAIALFAGMEGYTIEASIMTGLAVYNFCMFLATLHNT